MSRDAGTVTWGKSARNVSLDFGFAWSAIGYLCSPETPATRTSARVALCPRRRVEPCGTRALGGGASALLQLSAARSFGAPLLLLQNASAHTSRPQAAAGSAHGNKTTATHRRHAPAACELPSHLVAYQAPTTTSTTAAATTTTAPPRPRRRRHRPPTTTTTTAPPPPPTTTTTTAAPAVAATNSEGGDATWYAAAPDGYCASPTLAFGTVSRW